MPISENTGPLGFVAPKLYGPETKKLSCVLMVCRRNMPALVVLESVMPRPVVILDPEQRAAEKQARRAEDARRLSAGEISHEALAHQNDFFAAVDRQPFRIAAIGGRPIDA